MKTDMINDGSIDSIKKELSDVNPVLIALGKKAKSSKLQLIDI
jgi:hypothetical protein